MRGVSAALDGGAQPDCVEDPRSRDCVTPLIHAVRSDDLPMIETLLDRGASVNTNRLASSEAIEKRCGVATVQTLLARGARANGWKHDRHFPIHRLLAGGHGSKRYDDATRLLLLEALLDHGADPDARWDGQRTMLMECTLDEAKLLFSRGANPLLFNEHGTNALHSATTPELVRFLVTQAGVAVDTRTTPRSDFLRGCTALHLRLGDYYPSTGAVAALLELAADPHLVDAHGANAAFHCHRADDMDFLLSKAPSLDLRARMSDGGTLLHYCAAWREGRIADKRSFIQYVIERGCELDAQDSRGRTVLHLVAAKGELEDVQTILELGADRALTDRDGKTAGARSEEEARGAKAHHRSMKEGRRSINRTCAFGPSSSPRCPAFLPAASP